MLQTADLCVGKRLIARSPIVLFLALWLAVSRQHSDRRDLCQGWMTHQNANTTGSGTHTHTNTKTHSHGHTFLHVYRPQVHEHNCMLVCCFQLGLDFWTQLRQSQDCFYYWLTIRNKVQMKLLKKIHCVFRLRVKAWTIPSLSMVLFRGLSVGCRGGGGSRK